MKKLGKSKVFRRKESGAKISKEEPKDTDFAFKILEENFSSNEKMERSDLESGASSL